MHPRVHLIALAGGSPVIAPPEQGDQQRARW